MSNPDLALAESVSTTNATYFIAVYLLILIYCCFGLAVVCDVYFVPALQKLSYTYDLPPDIAGSTLMALGASVPELFASLVGVFVTEDDIGTGSIIGSSSFNLIAVPAACSFVASSKFGSGALSLNPMPVTRNSAFYAITILVLLLIIKDNQVDIPESVILLLFFVMYMAFMIFCAQSNRANKRLSTTQEDSKGRTESLADSAITSDVNDQTSQTSSSAHSDRSFSSDKTASYEDFDKATKKFKYGNNNYYLSADRFTQSNKQTADRVANNKQCQYYQFGNDQRTTDQAISKHFADYTAITLDSHVNKIDEKTPLVSGLKQSTYCYRNSIQFCPSYQQNYIDCVVVGNDKNSNVKCQYNDMNSFSVDLGIAIKNSTCLLKSTDIHDIHDQLFNSHGVDQTGVKQNNHSDGIVTSKEHSDWISSNWILVPMFPLTLSMKVLMPGKFKSTFWTIWAFLISVALIGALTYVSVWMVHLLGQLLGIPDTVAGMTILSWGTGIPELIASIVLIRKTAEADMAISNTIGSNVIDVSFCLSLPWIVKCLMNESYGLKPIVVIQSLALPWTTLMLLILVLLLLIILKCHNWKLCYGMGIWLMVAYVSFVIGSILLEYSFCNI